MKEKLRQMTNEEKYLDLLKRWRIAINTRVSMKPEEKYLEWFVELVRDTNTAITEYAENTMEEWKEQNPVLPQKILKVDFGKVSMPFSTLICNQIQDIGYADAIQTLHAKQDEIIDVINDMRGE